MLAGQALTAMVVYETDRSTTTDIVIRTQSGFLSLKKVTSANGHKTNLFSGFIAAGADVPWDEEQRYVGAQAKAARKWLIGFTADFTPKPQAVTPEEVFAAHDLDGLVTEKVRDHLRAAFGYIPTGDFADGARAAALAKTEVAQREHETAVYAEDAGFGIF